MCSYACVRMHCMRMCVCVRVRVVRVLDIAVICFYLVQVFCKNMHVVGITEKSTYANRSRWLILIKANKTTWVENYVNK